MRFDPPVEREPRIIWSFWYGSVVVNVKCAFVPALPSTPVSTYCVPVASTYSTNSSTTEAGTKSMSHWLPMTTFCAPPPARFVPSVATTLTTRRLYSPSAPAVIQYSPAGRTSA